jgi:uncharacterized membrane protein (UPF0182 family)
LSFRRTLTYELRTELQRSSLASTRWFRLFVGACFALFVIVIANAATRVVLDRVWHHNLGFGASYDTRLAWSVGMWVGSIAFSVGLPALCLARVRRIARAVFGQTGLVRPSLIVPLVVAVGFAVAPLLGGRSETAMLAVAGWRERMIGPNVLGVEAGFSVFRLPLLEAVSTWSVALSTACLVVSVAAAIGSGLIYRAGRGLAAVTPAVLRLVLVPFVGLCFTVAMRLWLARFDLGSRQNGELVGIFGLQRSWVVPMLSVLALGAVAIGAAVVPSSRRHRGVDHGSFDLWDELLLARVGVCVWLTAAVVGGVLIPAAAQSADPFPSPSDVSPLISHFASTVNAYDIDEPLRRFRLDQTEPPLKAGDARPGPVTLLTSALAKPSNRSGDPAWPVQTAGRNSVALAGLTAAASDAEVARTVNDKSLGVSLRSGWRRLLAAVRFGNVSMLTSEAIGGETVLVHYRHPVQRAHTIAPFLRFAAEPYLVELNGRRLWVVDGFTTANTFPGAQRFAVGLAGDRSINAVGSELNYLRASVKVIIDAVTGRVRFYRTDLGDPVARAWSRALPGLMRSGERLEQDYPGLAAQLRYPTDLLAFQAAAIGAYHSANADDLVDVTKRWVSSDLARPGASSPVLDVAYALPGDALPVRSAVRVLEPMVTKSVARYVVVGRVLPSGVARLDIDTVEGPRSIDVATVIDQHSRVRSLRSELERSKRSFAPGDLVPLPTKRYGLLYGVELRSVDDRGVMRTEAVVVGGVEGVAVGVDPNDAFGRYLALRGGQSGGGATPTTLPDGEFNRLQRELAENQSRLARSEAEVAELRRRVSVLESSGSGSSSTKVPVP